MEMEADWERSASIPEAGTDRKRPCSHSERCTAWCQTERRRNTCRYSLESGSFFKKRSSESRQGTNLGVMRVGVSLEVVNVKVQVGWKGRMKFCDGLPERDQC